MNNVYENKNECCGCSSCFYVCPHNAIDMVEDNCGFFYPQINQEKCINCGLCKSACMFNKPLNNFKYKEGFLSKNKNFDVCIKSTSGGMFSAIAQNILEKNGVVYSPLFSSDMKLEHVRITSVEDLDKALGSKYVQSNIADSIKLLIEDLKQGKQVVFFGTPCQIDAVLNLSKKADNLITVDVICNGVGSPLAFNKHIKKIEKKYHKKVVNYNFRPKNKGYLSTSEIACFDNGSEKIINYSLDKYNTWYYNGLITRPSCSNCKYTSVNRVSDITIGDFSKAKNLFPEFDSSAGASTLLINTEKGQRIFNEIKHLLEYVNLSDEEIMQKRLQECSTFNARSETFLLNCNKFGIKKAINKEVGFYKRLKTFIASIIYKNR